MNKTAITIALTLVLTFSATAIAGTPTSTQKKLDKIVDKLNNKVSELDRSNDRLWQRDMEVAENLSSLNLDMKYTRARVTVLEGKSKGDIKEPAHIEASNQLQMEYEAASRLSAILEYRLLKEKPNDDYVKQTERLYKISHDLHEYVFDQNTRRFTGQIAD